MGAGISIIEAIATLRSLHDAGYDLGPLHIVAIQHDPDLAAGCGPSEIVQARYRDALAKASNAPSIELFRSQWEQVDLGSYDAERVEYAWSKLSCDQRTAAVEGIAPVQKARENARLTRKISAAGYLLAGSWIHLNLGASS